jgi:hypothetical protein
MRSNHGDEHTFLELNPVQWTFENPPKVGFGPEHYYLSKFSLY